MAKKLTQEEFIAKARAVHGDKYDYSKAEYVNDRTRVCIICPEHGPFWQRPNGHFHGYGCNKCGYIKAGLKQSLSAEQFINKSKAIHGDKYDYSKVEYINTRTEVCIICPEHGEFWQTPDSHLGGHGCRDCGYLKVSEDKSDTVEDFKRKSKIAHGNKYDYSEVDYKDCYIPVKIICPTHGEFYKPPYHHIAGIGCVKCSNKYHKSTNEFIEASKNIHGEKYRYDRTVYISNKKSVIITCPIHGDFEQNPYNHLNGADCPCCKESKGEKYISEWLDKKNIDYKRELKIVPKQASLFGRKRFMVDFYIPSHNIIIEYHGLQHYIRQPLWQTQEQFQEQQDRDKRLREHCKMNNIKLIEIPYNRIKEIDKILDKKIGGLK